MNPSTIFSLRTTFVTVKVWMYGMLVATFAAGALAQGVPLGTPQDWSHRHLIYSNPETLDEAAENGTLEEWAAKANDPRFVVAVEKKQRGQFDSSDTEVGGSTLLRLKKKAPPIAPTGAQMPRDWSNVMGGASGVGSARAYPAKFAFDTSTKSCSSDFAVFTTAAAGAASSGTVNSRPGTFTGVPLAGEQVTITNVPYNPDQVLTLTADASENTGLKFAVGASATEAAANLASAIARNGGTVGVTATSSLGTVTVTSITTAVLNANLTFTEGLSNFTWGTQTAGTGTAGQPTIFALNQLYKDTQANGGCQTATQAVPAVYWSYNTGAGAVADLSPVLSFYDDGAQVAFMQRSTTNVSSLVLLKWSSSSPGTLGVPTSPTSVTTANYRACSAPCMTVIALSPGTVNNTNSAPFVDYVNDVLYVGDDTGKLHKFTGVFQGTPAEVVVAGTWPASVGTTSILSSPVYDPVSGLVFVGSNGPNATGNRLHSVNASSGAVVSSGQIGSASSLNGVRDAPIVDPIAQRVYAFIGADNTADNQANPDTLGNSCLGTKQCAAVYQFATSSSLAVQGLGSRVIVGASDNQGDLNRTINAGAFDAAYYSSVDPASPGGSLYVCGSLPGTARTFTLWKITIAGNSFSARTQGPQLTSTLGAGTSADPCSPVTVFSNGSSEYLFASVTNNGSAIGGGGCTTPANGCVYMYNLKTGASFDTTSTSAALNSTLYVSASASTAPNATESVVQTTLSSAQAGTYYGMTITQGAVNGNATARTYTLRKNGANTPITCTIALSQSTCSDTTNTATFVANDTIDVQMTRSSGTQSLTTTVQVQLGWTSGLGASAAINATGGTGGIVVDNTAGGGGSQVYFSTRTSPGIAVQASQAGLN